MEEIDRKKYSTDIIDNSYKLQIVMDRWKGLLGLESETIKVIKAPNHALSSNACVEFIREDQSWYILYREELTQRLLIHEIGHIYLDKHLNWLDVYKSTKRPSGYNKEIAIFYNSLSDCFNDYHLYKFPEYQNLFNLIKAKELAYHYNYFNENNLAAYLLFYTIYNSIITKQLKVVLESDIKAYLIGFRRHLIKKSKEVGGKITLKLFAKLNYKLNSFEKVKDTRDMKTFVNYVYEVLSVFPFWSKKELLKELSIISRFQL